MLQDSIVLEADRGDETLGRVRFVAHGTTNGSDAGAIVTNGMQYIVGRPVFSTNLVHANDWTRNPAKQIQSAGNGPDGSLGSVVILALHEQVHLGYGVHTTAVIHRSSKLVDGAPLKYAGARKQLALYHDADTVAARASLEQEIRRGYTLEMRPRFRLDPSAAVGYFPGGDQLTAILAALDTTIRALEPVDFDRFGTALAQVFVTRTPATAVLVPVVCRDLLIGTTESIVMSRLRMMRWQGLAMLGYRFLSGGKEETVAAVKSAQEQRARIDDYNRKLASSALFTAELAWLKVFALRQLELMRVELEAAALEASD